VAELIFDSSGAAKWQLAYDALTMPAPPAVASLVARNLHIVRSCSYRRGAA
jgi:hypothetical protein